jgi:hypothetical protein
MRRLSIRHLLAGIMLVLQLPILAPFIVCALVTGLVAMLVDRLTALHSTLATLRLPEVTIRHQHSSPA